MSLMVTNFGPMTSLRFRGGTCDEFNGLKMEPVTSESISNIHLISKNHWYHMNWSREVDILCIHNFICDLL